MRTTSCLNLPPPTPNQAFNNKPPQLPALTKEGGRRRRQCMMMKMMTCALIGLEMSNLVSYGIEDDAHAFMMMMPVVSASSETKWSEKRACPSWRDNSFETVVPENLPRPVTRRRYQTVRLRSSNSKTAPSLTLPVQTKPDCFSM